MLKQSENSIIDLENGASSDFSKLLNAVGDSKFVLMGEATHGTHEFYKARAEISKKLILEKNFTAVAIEGDWPNAYKVNKFVKGYKKISQTDALSEFKRFPVWMWRNKDVLEFITWMKNHNASFDLEDRVGFYGLDLYSLHESAHEVISYLNDIDKQQAEIAKQRYSCFDKFGSDIQNYGYLTSHHLSPSCEQQAIDQVKDLLDKKYEFLKQDGYIAQEEFFAAQQNASLVKNAEQYYRTMFTSSFNESWNLRDTHMFETLKSIKEYEDDSGKESKIIVWAHNSHVGDARHTQFGQMGQLNIGQLARQNFKNTFLLGFTTYDGSVSASSDWGNVTERKSVRPALAGSYENYFHNLRSGDFAILLNEPENDMPKDMLQRAIGVIYLPETERVSHYFYANINKQFDAVIHFDKTQAVEPLEKTSTWIQGELPDTYPSGI